MKHVFSLPHHLGCTYRGIVVHWLSSFGVYVFVCVLLCLSSFPIGTVLYGMDKLLVSKEEKLKAREKLFQARRERVNFW